MGEAKMNKKKEIVLERQTEAKVEGVEYLPLSVFKLKPELFRHRDEAELSEAKLRSLCDSLIVHGQEEPVEYAEIGWL
jgi:hypothetical protein